MLLFALLLLLNPANADEALVMVGGDYLPGFLDNEVEVWSPSPTCTLQVPSTPDYFVDEPGIAVLEEEIYVCGGSYIHGQPRDLCDIYSLSEEVWREGPALNTEIVHVKMTAVGSTLIAVAIVEQHISVQMLRQGETTWTESFPIPDLMWFMRVEDLVVVNDEKVIIPIADTSQYKNLFLLNIKTGEAKEVSDIKECFHTFRYEGKISCVREGEENEIVSVVNMEDDYTNIEWDVVGTIPGDVWYDNQYETRVVRVVEGMLTVLHARDGKIFYEEEGQWKQGEPLDILRESPSSVVVNC